MARRRTRRKPTKRRQKRGINLVNTAELYMQTAVLTNGLGNCNPLTFLTGLEYGTTVYGSGRAGSSVDSLGYFPSAQSVTIPELLGLDKMAGTRTTQGIAYASQGAIVPFGQGVQTLKDNARANAVQMMVQSIGVRAGFAIGKKLFSKQRSFINNKVLKPLNMKSMVVV
jgi:hypothetical protein